MNDCAPDTRTISDYLSALRSGAPTPGGGSAAAIAGSLGTGLLAMVCRLTLNSASADTRSTIEPAADRLDDLVEELSRSARADEAVYGQYRTARAMPKATSDETAIRAEALQRAVLAAAETPLHSAQLALEALRIGARVAATGSRHALSDVETARLLLDASIAGALGFVEVNAGLINSSETSAQLRRRAADLHHQASQASKDIWTELAARR